MLFSILFKESIFLSSPLHHNVMEEMSGQIRTWEELRFLEVGKSNPELIWWAVLCLLRAAF